MSARYPMLLQPGSIGDFVFVKGDGEPYKAIVNMFKSACRRAGLKDVSPHCLRHTFASRLAMMGYDTRSIQELGRRKDIRMVVRYASLSPSHKVQAIEALSAETPKNSTTKFTTAKTEKAVG